MTIRVEDFWINDNRWTSGIAKIECPDLGCKWYVDAHGETLGDLLEAARWHIAHSHDENGSGVMAEIVGQEPIGRRETVECTCDLMVQYAALPYADREGYREEWRPSDGV